MQVHTANRGGTRRVTKHDVTHRTLTQHSMHLPRGPPTLPTCQQAAHRPHHVTPLKAPTTWQALHQWPPPPRQHLSAFRHSTPPKLATWLLQRLRCRDARVLLPMSCAMDPLSPVPLRHCLDSCRSPRVPIRSPRVPLQPQRESHWTTRAPHEPPQSPAPCTTFPTLFKGDLPTVPPRAMLSTHAPPSDHTRAARHLPRGRTFQPQPRRALPAPRVHRN